MDRLKSNEADMTGRLAHGCTLVTRDAFAYVGTRKQNGFDMLLDVARAD